MRVYSAIKSVTLPQETILTSLSGVIKASDVDALQGYTVRKKKEKSKPKQLAHARMAETCNNTDLVLKYQKHWMDCPSFLNSILGTISLI